MGTSDMSAPRPFIHIRPHTTVWQNMDFRELRQYKDLVYYLVAKEIKIRYKQTVLGGLWAIIQPFFSMVVFSLFFGRLGRIPSDGVPYPIFSFTAMVAWTYFSNALSGSGNSLIANDRLISKIYFPRLIIPLAPVLAGLLDFSIAFIILLLMMLYFHIIPTAMIFIFPFLVLFMVLTASGVGLFLGALNAQYRDIRYAIPFLVQIWMFLSPVVYPTSMVPEQHRILYSINPMVGIIEGFRSVLLGNTLFPTYSLLLSLLVSSLTFILGSLYFKRVERHFADII
jgi:lipopolysaccharide transport system permease protein